MNRGPMTRQPLALRFNLTREMMSNGRRLRMPRTRMSEATVHPLSSGLHLMK
jgi:hypothetical protein